MTGSTEQAAEFIRRVAEAARTLKHSGPAMRTMAANPEQREMLEKALAEFNVYHSVLAEATREVGQCRVLLTKALSRRSFGYRA